MLADFVRATPSKYYRNTVITFRLSNFVTYLHILPHVHKRIIFVSVSDSLSLLRLGDPNLLDFGWFMILQSDYDVIKLRKIKYDVILVKSSKFCHRKYVIKMTL